MKKNLKPLEEDVSSSDKLKALVQSEILLQGPISFSRYMQLALYHPNYGYYQVKKNIFGSDGDFVTSPNISTMFAETFLNDFKVIFASSSKNILELGAGNGSFCQSVMQLFDEKGVDIDQYYIIESSPTLVKSCQQRLKENLSSAAYSKINWLKSLPSSFKGVVFMNEFFDALPVDIFVKKDDKLFEKCVSIKNDKFIWVLSEMKGNQYFENLPIHTFPADYTFEFSNLYKYWVDTLKKTLQQGAIYIVDYGFHDKELFHPDRSTGTLMCYLNHQSHSDPLINIGQQDISCHVNFSLLKNLFGDDVQIEGFVSQASYLINANILDILKSYNPKDVVNYSKKTAELNMLISPAEMGDLIKVMSVSKEVDIQLHGFSKNDRSFLL
jgi:SAM-dependent MidA family methyltransferase